LAVKLNPVGGVGGELDFASLGAKPRDYVSNRPISLELLDHEYPIRGIFPNPQFVDSVAKHLFARIAVPPLKCSIYVQEPSFLQSRDGEGNGAGTKDFLKLLLREVPVSFRLSQRVLCFVEIRQPPL